MVHLHKRKSFNSNNWILLQLRYKHRIKNCLFVKGGGNSFVSKLNKNYNNSILIFLRLFCQPVVIIFEFLFRGVRDARDRRHDLLQHELVALLD